ncbi:reverse transcriptase domain-containing protein [Tanacetum coccineum]
MEEIKTKIGREKAGWVDELPNVLWAHQTSIKTSNGESPFSLTYGSEAVIPAEIGMPTYKTMMIREGFNEEEVYLTSFKPGEFVFRKNKASRVEDQGKLGPKWDRPYRVAKAYQNGSYKL